MKTKTLDLLPKNGGIKNMALTTLEKKATSEYLTQYENAKEALYNFKDKFNKSDKHLKEGYTFEDVLNACIFYLKTKNDFVNALFIYNTLFNDITRGIVLKHLLRWTKEQGYKTNYALEDDLTIDRVIISSEALDLIYSLKKESESIKGIKTRVHNALLTYDHLKAHEVKAREQKRNVTTFTHNYTSAIKFDLD